MLWTAIRVLEGHPLYAMLSMQLVSVRTTMLKRKKKLFSVLHKQEEKLIGKPPPGVPWFQMHQKHEEEECYTVQSDFFFSRLLRHTYLSASMDSVTGLLFSIFILDRKYTKLSKEHVYSEYLRQTSSSILSGGTTVFRTSYSTDAVW